ncbi:hypothetical protein DFH11DRAFT_451150 [Phellopilus nigrolimitatus]|nr:hypothetical protein DFH11DRAFT_451150 [Phellopilus nigrolimitatus]
MPWTSSQQSCMLCTRQWLHSCSKTARRRIRAPSSGARVRGASLAAREPQCCSRMGLHRLGNSDVFCQGRRAMLHALQAVCNTACSAGNLPPVSCQATHTMLDTRPVTVCTVCILANLSVRHFAQAHFLYKTHPWQPFSPQHTYLPQTSALADFNMSPRFPHDTAYYQGVVTQDDINVGTAGLIGPHSTQHKEAKAKENTFFQLFNKYKKDLANIHEKMQQSPQARQEALKKEKHETEMKVKFAENLHQYWMEYVISLYETE